MEDGAKVDIKHLPNKQWVVVRTKPRGEKKVHQHFLSHDIPAYLPLRRSVRRYQSRTVEFKVPIFSGYVFCQISGEELSVLNACRNTAHVIRPGSDMEMQLISELRSIQIFEEAMNLGELTVKPEIAIGNVVRIRSGPFAGLTGVVTRWKNAIRMAVNVELVGQSVMLEVDAGEVDVEY